TPKKSKTKESQESLDVNNELIAHLKASRNPQEHGFIVPHRSSHREMHIDNPHSISTNYEEIIRQKYYPVHFEAQKQAKGLGLTTPVVDKQVPTGCRDLKTMLNEVEVVICDIRKLLNFTCKKTNTTVVFVMNEAEKPLQNLKNDDIEWPYASLKRRDDDERRVLVKVKGTDRRAVVDYNLPAFLNKFPEIHTKYLRVVHHFFCCLKEVERSIEEHEKKLKDFTAMWQENGKNVISMKNNCHKIHQKLPEPYKSELNPVKAVEDYLEQIDKDNKVLYCYKLAKLFGLSQIRSAEGAATVIARIKNAHEKRESQFNSIQFDVVTSWIKKWFTYFFKTQAQEDDGIDDYLSFLESEIAKPILNPKSHALVFHPFNVPTMEQLQMIASQLYLPFHRYIFSNMNGASAIETCTFDKSKIHAVDADGNCGFRCLSYIITGKQDYHREIRRYVLEKFKKRDMPRYTSFWGDTINQRIKIHESALQISETQCCVPQSHWMNDGDLQAFASLVNVNIALAVYQPHLQYPWIFIESTLVSENGHLDPNLPTFLLDHTSNNHFNVITELFSSI
uniref:OTU domain-containing protein n=1 Tax=Panagrolaimus sp. JU765 TaxID=591449 RepID=A0AC34Q6R3_9BILA